MRQRFELDARAHCAHEIDADAQNQRSERLLVPFLACRDAALVVRLLLHSIEETPKSPLHHEQLELNFHADEFCAVKIGTADVSNIVAVAQGACTLVSLSLASLAPAPQLACAAVPSLRQGAAARRSSLLVPPTTALLQTLNMEVWGPARIRGQDQERYFLLVVDDYTRYTTVFSLRSKADVPGVLILSITAVRCQLRARFQQDLQVLLLHSDRGGEFSSRLLEGFCRMEGIAQSFTPPASPQQNGIAERRIGLIMEVVRTSMIHAVAPHFLWLFAVRYAAHQLNLWPLC
ncbi:unnamed protein product [Closterium sp. NIES-54]